MEERPLLCFATAASGPLYEGFVPIYIYSIRTAYPSAFVKVFFRRGVSPRMRRSLAALSSLGNFEVVEDAFADYPEANIATCRFLIREEDLKDFDHVYFGDVDFFILREEPSLLDQHLAHCRVLGTPYSNIVRPAYDRAAGRHVEGATERLTGLHFVQREPYFAAMTPIIERYRSVLKTTRVEKDEKILYAMVSEGLGEPPRVPLAEMKGWGERRDYTIGGVPTYSPEDALFRPYHGIHYGAFRPESGGTFKPSAVTNDRFYGTAYREAMKRARRDPVFLEIWRNTGGEVRDRIVAVDRYQRARNVPSRLRAQLKRLGI